jgi:hypothetical protein
VLIFADPSERTLRELKAEQDAEERFQADLEQAMRQSLGVLSLRNIFLVIRYSCILQP